MRMQPKMAQTRAHTGVRRFDDDFATCSPDFTESQEPTEYAWAAPANTVGAAHVSAERQPFISSCAFFSRSSRPPHMKKACSGKWSYSPSLIFLNASMVSLSGTVEPGTLVNCSAA